MKRKSNASICFSDFKNVLWWEFFFFNFHKSLYNPLICYLLCVELYGIHYIVYSMFSKGGEKYVCWGLNCVLIFDD